MHYIQCLGAPLKGVPLALYNMTNIVENSRFKEAWAVISPILSVRTEKDYDRAIELLNHLLDEVGDNAHHPLYHFLQVLGIIIESYEEDHIQIPEASPRDMVKFFME